MPRIYAPVEDYNVKGNGTDFYFGAAATSSAAVAAEFEAEGYEIDDTKDVLSIWDKMDVATLVLVANEMEIETADLSKKELVAAIEAFVVSSLLEPILSQFKFLDSTNAALSADVIAEINNADNSIAITLPVGTVVTALKASFVVPAGCQVKVGSDVQQSGVTANNFTNPVTYSVIKIDEPTNKVDYTITVTVAES